MVSEFAYVDAWQNFLKSAVPHCGGYLTAFVNARGARSWWHLYFGKLAPRGVDEVVAHPSMCGFNNNSGIDDLGSVAAVPRRRGRQSKDEQLAAVNRLPLSAREISEMTLGELHKVLKNLNLTEHQKQLIRKIRRRGKNKLAARTCRERRGERQRCLNEAETQWKELCSRAMYYYLDIYECYVMGDDTFALRSVAKRVTV
uniref:BZIP domain-containing protein n=1 Tax=Angiostrongylus cantonensis TaxID=6313 RepID=A0A0K0DEH7_ANGCA